MLAANTAFNGFPVLGSILAQDRYLPRQLHTRGDRLAYSNGIVILAGFATVLIVAFNAEVTRLIQLYIVGVFVSFTLSQTGMVRHWTRLLRTETEPAARRRMVRSRVINAVGLVVTGIVLVVVLITKFTHGAWIAIAAMVGAVPDHEGHPPPLRAGRGGAGRSTRTRTRGCPPATHAIVLVSKIHKPTMRAVNYARAMRPSTLEARDGQRRPGGDARAAAGVGPAQHPRAAEGARLAVPRGDRPGHRLCEERPARQPARPGHGAHPRVRRRALVGAPAAQPERAAAEGPAAVHPGRHGDQRALAARVVGGPGGTARRDRDRRLRAAAASTGSADKS